MMETHSTSQTKIMGPNPYFLMTVLYLFIAALIAVQTALIHFGILETVANLTWVRIHFITLGVLTQLIFGYSPKLINKNASPRFDIWLLLNAGLWGFFGGRSLFNSPVMITGGLLIFLATILFILHLHQLQTNDVSYPTQWFYIFGSIYLLIGITVGTGIWAGWSDELFVGNALEVHVHANNWGFLVLVFSGLFLDLFPRITQQNIHWPSSIPYVLIAQILGAFGLILGPWIGNVPISIVGMVFFLLGTITMLINFLWPLREKRSVGFYHIITGYFWIFLPLFVAPFVIFHVPGFEWVEPTAPQALIYGWVLQVGIAFVWSLIDQESNTLGGSWMSLILINLGAILLWISMFWREVFEILQGTAYSMWFIALIPIFWKLFSKLSASVSQ